MPSLVGAIEAFCEASVEDNCSGVSYTDHPVIASTAKPIRPPKTILPEPIRRLR